VKRWKIRTVAVSVFAILTLVAAACGTSKSNETTTSSSVSTSGQEPFSIALSLSFTGNDWQNEAANLVKAEALTPPYDQKVKLRVDIAGADVTKQIQTLNNEIAAGVNAIIVYPISPTALNATIQKACDQGIVVYAYDSLVTAPCAYNVHIDQYEWGIKVGTWLAKELGGKGQIAVITGVPGTTVSTDRQKALKDVLANYPDLKIAGSANGSWAQAQGKTAFTSIEAGNPNLDGVYAEAGCYAITQYLVSSGKTVLPCGGEMSNGHHLYMLSKEICAETNIPEENCVGLRSASGGSPVYSGELAFINAVKILEGKTVAHNIILPLPYFTTDDLSAASVGTNPAKGALVYPPTAVNNPGFFADFWSPLVEQGLSAALTGKPDKISDAKSCAEGDGCKTTDAVTFDAQHSGGN